MAPLKPGTRLKASEYNAIVNGMKDRVARIDSQASEIINQVRNSIPKVMMAGGLQSVVNQEKARQILGIIVKRQDVDPFVAEKVNVLLDALILASGGAVSSGDAIETQIVDGKVVNVGGGAGGGVTEPPPPIIPPPVTEPPPLAPPSFLRPSPEGGLRRGARGEETPVPLGEIFPGIGRLKEFFTALPPAPLRDSRGWYVNVGKQRKRISDEQAQDMLEVRARAQSERGGSLSQEPSEDTGQLQIPSPEDPLLNIFDRFFLPSNAGAAEPPPIPTPPAATEIAAPTFPEPIRITPKGIGRRAPGIATASGDVQEMLSARGFHPSQRPATPPTDEEAEDLLVEVFNILQDADPDEMAAIVAGINAGTIQSRQDVAEFLVTGNVAVGAR